MKGIKKMMIYFNLIKQFGLRYSLFRVRYEVSKKLGWLKPKYPQVEPTNPYIKCSDWQQKKYQSRFFLSDYHSFQQQVIGNPEITKADANRVLKGDVLFFFNDWKRIKLKEWNIHPVTGHEYDMQHWSQLPIYSKTFGDIKYVWEKSKFSYLLYVARNDYKYKEDHSEFVVNEIINWIEHNPPNTGPQYICSQEISIRLMNWSFLLFFYSKSKHLTEKKFNRILNAIQIQLDHVYQNINYSRIAVKNNHAVTECLALYLIPTYFPFLNQADTYKAKGLEWFVSEIKDQLYTDGSDKQFSFNYHRVKVQLFCWYLATAKANKEEIPRVVLERAKGSLQFLYNLMGNTEKGYLPNYGSNDGSIYFKLNDADYRDYRPQLKALADLLELNLAELNDDGLYNEDSFFYTQNLNIKKAHSSLYQQQGIINYPIGGYVLMKKADVLTLFKTPEYNDRIAQDDYFHLDIWYKGVNLFMDTGSYLYNTTPETINYFKGVKGHNTVSINGGNHLQKGPLFTWIKPPRHIGTHVEEQEEYYEISSHMALQHPYAHELIRSIRQSKTSLEWQITDEVRHLKKGDRLVQTWKHHQEFKGSIRVLNLAQQDYTVETTEGYYSLYYGTKSVLNTTTISTSTSKLITQLKITS